MQTDALVPSLSITNLLAQREAAVSRLSQVHTLLNEIHGICNALPSKGPLRLHFGPGDLLCARGFTHALALTKEGGLERATRLFDAYAWQFLLDASGMRSFLDTKAREEWTNSITSQTVPPLTEENITATFTNLYACRSEMLERGIIEVFKGLSWRYKTNQPEKMGKRVVLRWLAQSSSAADQLDDLVRVMHVLDSRPEPDHRSAMSTQLLQAGLLTPGSRGTLEGEYVKVTVFKNRNGHLTFKRPDLVDIMNRVIAKHFPGALPAPR